MSKDLIDVVDTARIVNLVVDGFLHVLMTRYSEETVASIATAARVATEHMAQEQGVHPLWDMIAQSAIKACEQEVKAYGSNSRKH